MQTIGDRIRAFRDSRGLTQKEIFQATKGEIKQTTLSAIEKGQAKPGFDTLAALLQAYQELSADWLLRAVGPMIMGDPAPVLARIEDPAAAYAAPANAIEPLVHQLIQQLAEEKRQHREEMRELKKEYREDERAAATNHENIVADMRRQIDNALAEVERVREEKDARIYQLEGEVHMLKLRAGLRPPTEEEAKQLAQQAPTTKKVKGLRSYEEEQPQAEEALMALSYSNPAFIRPQAPEQEVTLLRAA